MQSRRIGLALWWLVILPGWVITPVVPARTTHGTPVPNSGKAVGGPIRRSASQQLIDTKCKSCLTGLWAQNAKNDEHERWAQTIDERRTTSLTKSAKNDFINEARGVDNSIGDESTTNSKFDEESITNDKIVEESASRASKSVNEYAVKKDEAARSAMSRRLCRVRIRTSRRVNQVNAQRQHQSRLPVPMPSQWSTRTWVSSCVTWETRTRSDLRGVTEDTRCDLRRRQQRRVIEDANEDCQSAPDAIHSRGGGHQTINSKKHWMIHVSTSAWDRCQQFKSYVHRWWQWGVWWRTDVKVQILSAWVLERDTDTEEESRWGNRWDFQGIVSDRTTCSKWRIGVTSRRSEEAWGASECGEENRRVPRDGVDNSELASWWVEVNVCKDDRKEEIAKFDGDTIRKETVFRNVSIVNNLKATSEGFWLGVNKNRVARKDEMRAESRGTESCRASSADVEENWWGNPAYSASTSMPNTDRSTLYSRFWSRVSKCWESSTLKSACSNTFKRVCSNTVEFGVSNSSLEFERLTEQANIAERLPKETVSNACQKSPTHRCITSTWTARRRHRLSKFHSNCTRAWTLMCWKSGDAQMVQQAEQVPVSCTSGRKHCRVTTTCVNDSKGTGVSTLIRRTTRAEWSEHLEGCTVERQVQRIQKIQLKPQWGPRDGAGSLLSSTWMQKRKVQRAFVQAQMCRRHVKTQAEKTEKHSAQVGNPHLAEVARQNSETWRRPRARDREKQSTEHVMESSECDTGLRQQNALL